MGVVEVLVDTFDVSSGSLLVSLISLLLISALAFAESSLGLNGEFSLLSVVFIGSLFHLSKSNSVGVQSFQSNDIL